MRKGISPRGVEEQSSGPRPLSGGSTNRRTAPNLQRMKSSEPQPVTIIVNDAQRVSGLLQAPTAARACYVLAHGAGAGMAHPFQAAIASGLAERGIATL